MGNQGREPPLLRFSIEKERERQNETHKNRGQGEKAVYSFCLRQMSAVWKPSESNSVTRLLVDVDAGVHFVRI